MKKLIYLFALFPLISHGTSVFISIKGNVIYAAADSRIIGYNLYHPSEKLIEDNFCKIRSYNGVYFAVAGYSGSTMAENALSALKGETGFKKMIEKYQSKVGGDLLAIMKVAERFERKRYKEYIATGDAIGQISFFGFKNNKPFIFFVEFVIANKKGQPIKVICSTRYTTSIAMGYHDHIDKQSFAEKYVLLNKFKNPLLFQEELVKIESKAHKDEVGGPIDLLELYTTGPTWIRKKQFCN